jgi:two-component system phosphate regulon response regulator PhoB
MRLDFGLQSLIHNSTMASILVIEDEPDAAELLAFNLRAAGHEVTLVDDGGRGLRVAQTTRPDLILLDRMLPTMSGIEICRALRGDAVTQDLPIIMLTARAAESDRVKGFECGADDYVTKPFSMRELMLRVQSLLKRRQPVNSVGQQLKAGDLVLDLASQSAQIEGEQVRLTGTETKLLAMLLRAGGQSVSRQQLLTDVWQYAADSDTRTVDSHIKRLRSKLGPLAHYVETVQGVGYRLSVG